MLNKSVITVAIVATLYLFYQLSFWSPTSFIVEGTLPVAPKDTSDEHEWTYDYDLHAHHHALSSDQCSAAFPDFYRDIETAVASRRSNPVQPAELEVRDGLCLARILIYDGQIFIVQGQEKGGCWIDLWHERLSGFLHSINRAIAGSAPASIPNVEFLLSIDDDSLRPSTIMHGTETNETTIWGLTRLEHQRQIWLVPDYAYWAWPSAGVTSHSQVMRKTSNTNDQYPWEKKQSKVVWRGTTGFNPGLRESLLQLADGTDWGDVQICDPHIDSTKKNCITQEDHCKWMFPVHTEGITYSGRLKYMQMCNSAPVVHRLQWLEHHYHLMQSSGPNQNYIQVENDWADLEDKVHHYLAHQDEAKMIAQNNHDTFGQRYLTPAAQSCYWRQIIHSWASVQAFKPTLYERDAATERDVLRGVPFEAWAIEAGKSST